MVRTTFSAQSGQVNSQTPPFLSASAAQRRSLDRISTEPQRGHLPWMVTARVITGPPVGGTLRHGETGLGAGVSTGSAERTAHELRSPAIYPAGGGPETPSATRSVRTARVLPSLPL